ncbi:MAG: hypothetical protein HY319_02485 [Armatimonadetes bacterium]|nr:hypothetical protein [Armatimonadota bacterium]
MQLEVLAQDPLGAQILPAGQAAGTTAGAAAATAASTAGAADTRGPSGCPTARQLLNKRHEKFFDSALSSTAARAAGTTDTGTATDPKISANASRHRIYTPSYRRFSCCAPTIKQHNKAWVVAKS